MTLKYLFAFGDNRVLGISRNYRFFHIPIDNIIQNKLEKKFGIKRLNGAWSKAENYPVYLNYQYQVRLACAEQIPMDVEFKLFNQVS
jgi:hypothetical protein